MAAGDVYNILSSSVATAGTFNIQPPSGVEITVHNVYAGAASELYWGDGTNFILIDTVGGAGGWFNQAFHCTNTRYLRVINRGSAAFFAADGMTTK